jgi:hypothetical protein
MNAAAASVDDATHAGDGAWFEIAVLSPERSIGWVRRRFAMLATRGVRVEVRRGGRRDDACR